MVMLSTVQIVMSTVQIVMLSIVQVVLSTVQLFMLSIVQVALSKEKATIENDAGSNYLIYFSPSRWKFDRQSNTQVQPGNKKL